MLNLDVVREALDSARSRDLHMAFREAEQHAMTLPIFYKVRDGSETRGEMLQQQLLHAWITGLPMLNGIDLWKHLPETAQRTLIELSDGIHFRMLEADEPPALHVRKTQLPDGQGLVAMIDCQALPTGRFILPGKRYLTLQLSGMSDTPLPKGDFELIGSEHPVDVSGFAHLAAYMRQFTNEQIQTTHDRIQEFVDSGLWNDGVFGHALIQEYDDEWFNPKLARHQLFGFVSDCQGYDVRETVVPREIEDCPPEIAEPLEKLSGWARRGAWGWSREREERAIKAMFWGPSCTQLTVLSINEQDELSWSDSGALAVVASARSWPDDVHGSDGRYEGVFANISTS